MNLAPRRVEHAIVTGARALERRVRFEPLLCFSAMLRPHWVKVSVRRRRIVHSLVGAMASSKLGAVHLPNLPGGILLAVCAA